MKTDIKYNPETGTFTYESGKAAGYSHNGYLRLTIHGVRIMAHVYAFFVMTGEVPEMVDHINGNRSDNRWCNLRACSASENMHNRKLNANSETKVKGVRLHPNGKYQVRVGVNNKRLSLGYYEDLELAELVANEARSKYHKEFANAGY